MDQHTNNLEKKPTQVRTIIIVSAIIFGVLALIALISNITILSSQNARIARMQAEQYALEQTINQNNNDIAWLGSPEHIEEYARGNLGMVGENEHVFKGR